MEHVILKCNLTNERRKLTVHLSGGNKRKLSLAMALSNNSYHRFLKIQIEVQIKVSTINPANLPTHLNPPHPHPPSPWIYKKY